MLYLEEQEFEFISETAFLSVLCRSWRKGRIAGRLLRWCMPLFCWLTSTVCQALCLAVEWMRNWTKMEDIIMAPQIPPPLLAHHHDLYPALLHLPLPHVARMVSVLATLIFYLAVGCMFNVSFFIICVFFYSTLFACLPYRCDLFCMHSFCTATGIV
jgi:hypothetical protein